ncbi:MAG: guanylate kinase [Rickettsiales bacterium]
MSITLHKQSLMVILSSPSGAGKTTLARALVASDKKFVLSVSATTREKRRGEEEGKDYYFIDKQKFEDMLENEEFLEHAEVFNNLYGTPKKQTFEILKEGKDVVYDIDWQGALQLYKTAKKHIVSIFILPPSMRVLKERLMLRNSESIDSFNTRFNEAKNEIQQCGQYQYIIVNDDIETSLKEIRHIVEAERLRTERQDTRKIISDLI